jgi:hypothetical protein
MSVSHLATNRRTEANSNCEANRGALVQCLQGFETSQDEDVDRGVVPVIIAKGSPTVARDYRLKFKRRNPGFWTGAKKIASGVPKFQPRLRPSLTLHPAHGELSPPLKSGFFVFGHPRASGQCCRASKRL